MPSWWSDFLSVLRALWHGHSVLADPDEVLANDADAEFG